MIASSQLALKGLEAERQRINEEMADIPKQIRGGGQRSRSQAKPQSQAISAAIGGASSADEILGDEFSC